MKNPLKGRFELVPGQHRARPIRNGLIVTLLGLFFLGYLYTDGAIVPLPDDSRTVKAEFPTAVNIELSTSDVRLRGVSVGTVGSVERGPGGDGAVVELKIDEKKLNGVKIREDASAHIYWRTLLGYQFYVELDPGSAPQELADGAVLTMESNTSQVEADQLLGSFDGDARDGLATMFDELDVAADSRAPGATIDALAPAMRQIAPGLDALTGAQPGDLSGTVRDASRLVQALRRSETELGQLFANADGTLAVTAARRGDIDSMLKQAPAVLQQNIETMARFRTTLAELDPIAEDLRPGARELDDASEALQPALRELNPALADARPLLRDLRPALSRLGKASRRGSPLLDALDPTLDRTRGELIPWLNTVERETNVPNKTAIGALFASISSTASLFDTNGFIQRFHAVAGGGRSASFLPCTLEFPVNSGLDCSDLEGFAGGLLGLEPEQTQAAVRKGKK